MAYDWGKGVGGAMIGAKSGSAIGSVVPGIGTVIGGAVGGLAGGAMGFLGGDDDDNGPAFYFEPPEYYLNDEYGTTQSQLKSSYGDILGGNLNEYYKPIGEYGGDFFNSLISDISNDVTRGVSKSVDEDLSRQGITRGGLGTSIKAMTTADALAGVVPQLRLSDYERALTARGDLLGIGLTGMESVRDSALTETEIRNRFNLGASGLALDAAKFGAQLTETQGSASDEILRQIMSIGTKMATDKLTGGAVK